MELRAVVDTIEVVPVSIEVIMVIGVIALAGVAAYFAHLQAKKRREALLALARELGWGFDPSKDYSHDDEFANFEIFRKGRSRAAYNTLSGQLDVGGRSCDARMGDFRYKVTHGSGKNRRTHTYRFSYLIVTLPYWGVPALLIRPEGVFDKIASAIGFDDIDFESEEFSRRFYVKSSDRRFAYDVIHARMMRFLLDTCKHTVDIEHGRCCISDGRSKWSPEQFRARAQWVHAFLERWPDHLTRVLEESGAAAQSR